MQPTSLPLTPNSQQDNAMYASYDWIGYVAKFGVSPPSFDFTLPIQNFFDSSFAQTGTFDGVHFNPTTGLFDSITIPGIRMLTPNIPTPEQMQSHLLDNIQTTPVPSYSLLSDQTVKEAAPGFFQIVNSSPSSEGSTGITTVADKGTLTQTQRDAILIQILQKVSA